MNMLKKGPELKMPDIKIPDFLLDLYYDLRERHLLPLVGILLVAVVALPIVLSSSSSDSEAAESEAAVATPSTALPSSKLVVAKAAPGLRDYRKRLAGKPTDPFAQKYTTKAAGEGDPAGTSVGITQSSSSSEGAASGDAESASKTTEPEAPSTTPEPDHGSAPGDNGEPSDAEHLQYYSFAIDVRVVPVPLEGSTGKPEPSVRHDLPALTMLPSRDTPALTFMTVSKDEKKVVMLVNDNVRGLFGDGVCMVGTDTCQLLALEPGIPETVVYGAEERTYRIEVLKLRLLTSDHLNKAPLGKEKQQSGKPKSAG